MSIKKVRDAINEVAAIFEIGGAKTQGKELNALGRLLATFRRKIRPGSRCARIRHKSDLCKAIRI
jgi:hypothetical protein